jgi:hypothetical protein
MCSIYWGIFALNPYVCLRRVTMKKILILSVLSACSILVKAQNLFPDYRFKVIENGDTLLYPFAGGLNTVIWAEIDLDGNNILDLIALEKTTGRILPFLNYGTSGQVDYHYAPQYVEKIPELNEWVRSYDYDCDGDLDLFTYNISYTFNSLGEGAIRVYRNDYSSGTGLQFTAVANELISSQGTVLKLVPAAPVNLPAFTDVDGDGDMDILTFSLSSNFVEYHRNYSMDSTGVCDGFIFHADGNCWGAFKLSGVGNLALLNNNCQSIPDNTTHHSGSVLMAFDMGCDGDKDVINGDILGSNLLYLENGGSAASALITAQDSAFPDYDVQVNYFNLPGSYYFDADNDGKKDIIVSGFGLVGEDYNNVLFYKNTTDNCSNVIQYIKSRLIVEDMIDVGTTAVPVFFDADNDGLMDLIVGDDFYYSVTTSQKVARLAWYKNTGTATAPQFTLMDTDFADVSALGILGAYPAFGDLDNDGDQDMLLGNVNGDLIYFQNTGGSPANFVFTTPAYQGIDVGANSMPQLIDVDRDGLTDLLIGERTGVINYYRNTGTAAAPVFTLVTSNFGGVNVIKPGAIQGNSAPLLYDNNGSYELLVGSDYGNLFYYTNIDGNLGGNFTLADTSYEDIYEPMHAIPSRYDIDGDLLPDLMIGNSAGGLKLYTHYNNTAVETLTHAADIYIYPNPAGDQIRINGKTEQDCRADITGVDGRVYLSAELHNSRMLDISSLSPGIYILRLYSAGKTQTTKFVKQ